MNAVKEIRAMFKSMILPALLLSLAAGSCLAKDVSFKKILVPIFQRNCVACHMTGEEQGGLGLMPKLAYGNLVGKPSSQSKLPRVAPRDPERSYLMHKLRGTHLDQGGSGALMPMGLQPLSDEEMAQIVAWIEAGALNN